MDSSIEPQLLLTDAALDWLLETQKPICSSDFIGYIFTISNRSGVAGSVDIFGNIRLFSTKKNQQVLSEKKACKHIKKLLDTNFLELDIEPFPEFSKKFNLPIDPTKTVFIEEPLFTTIMEDNEYGNGELSNNQT